MIVRLRALLRDNRGGTVVEFAIVAPIFVMMIFGLIEGSRVIWTKSVLQETAYATARCVAIGDTACTNHTTAKSAAVTRAAQSEITITASNVTITTPTTCDGIAGMTRVVITSSFNSPLGFLSGVFPSTLSTTSCMPVLS